MDIFELRKHRIEMWEMLPSVAENVVFVNYEALLADPAGIVLRWYAAFPSLFGDNIEDGVRKIETDVRKDKYVEKYFPPEPFAPDDVKCIDDNLVWSLEEVIGYKKGDFIMAELNSTDANRSGLY